MKASKTLVPLTLFALAFASSLFVLRRPDLPDAAAAGVEAAAMQARRTGSHADAASSATWLGSAASLDAATSPHTPAQLAADSPQPADGTTPAEPAASLPAPAPPPAFSDDPAPPIDTALDTLQYGTPDDRVRAIQSLATTAPDSAELTRVRSSLRLAAADDDPDIAARAQEAYDSLLKREDP